eukprot:6509873-Pyramimonas_sp.AAC.1
MAGVKTVHINGRRSSSSSSSSTVGVAMRPVSPTLKGDPKKGLRKAADSGHLLFEVRSLGGPRREVFEAPRGSVERVRGLGEPLGVLFGASWRSRRLSARGLVEMPMRIPSHGRY